MVQLSDDLVDALDAEATIRGVSRSALIREALSSYLSEIRSADVGRRIVAGYHAHPPQTPDTWGATDLLADVAVTELTQRLEAEEHSEGHASW